MCILSVAASFTGIMSAAQRGLDFFVQKGTNRLIAGVGDPRVGQV